MGKAAEVAEGTKESWVHKVHGWGHSALQGLNLLIFKL